MTPENQNQAQTDADIAKISRDFLKAFNGGGIRIHHIDVVPDPDRRKAIRDSIEAHE